MWSAEMLKFAYDLFYVQNLRGKEVATAVNHKFGTSFSTSALRGVLHREFVAERGTKRINCIQQTAERNQEMIRRISDGQSPKSVAVEFGVSKANLRVLAPQAANGVRWHRALQRLGLTAGPSMDKRPKDYSLEGSLTIAGKNFDDLALDECRFSVGRDAEGGYRFCGACRWPTSRSYCLEHHKLTSGGIPNERGRQEEERGLWSLECADDPVPPQREAA